MRTFLKRKLAQALDSRKFDGLWEWINNTYFGYYLRKYLLSFMGIAEDASIRKIVAKEAGYFLGMTHPHDHKNRFNVLLIQLPFPSNVKHKRILPMGLASLASYLRDKLPDINVGILDAQCQNMTYEDIIEKTREVNWDVIGVSCWSVQSEFAKKISKGIKNEKGDTVIVHGGVHATVMPEESLETADFAVLHEGEETFAELVSTLKRGGDIEKVKGIAFTRQGKTIFTGTRPLIPNLDELPKGAYDLLPIQRYKMPLHVVGGERLPVMGSRGCPYNCSFCTSPNLWQNKVRWKSGKNVADEIEWLIERYNVRKFHFWDDNFTLNPKFVRDFCGELKRRRLKIEWVALDRAEHINKNKDLLPIMKDAGCIGIEIGLESANPDTFAHISKDQGLEDSRNAIKNLKENDIYPLYTCMAFNPGESIVGYYMQKEFLDMAQEGYPWHKFFHPYSYSLYIGQFATPYPKTQFWDNLEKQSMILVDDPEDRFHHQINSVPYSLLEDIPIRNVQFLDEELYVAYLNAVKLNMWRLFPGSDSREVLGKKLYEIWKVVNLYYELCDGKNTVKDIGSKISDRLSIDFNKSMRLTAFATYIYAQLGAIRSAVHFRDYPIERKYLKIPLAIKLDICDLLKPYGLKRKDLSPRRKS